MRRPQEGDGRSSPAIRHALLDGAEASSLMAALSRAAWRPVTREPDLAAYEVAAAPLSERISDQILRKAGEHFTVSRLVGPEAIRLGAGAWISRLANPGARAGFLLDLNPHWRSQWGGLTLFPTGPDAVTGHRPEAGALTLFGADAGPMISLVTPDAAAPRVSILGWLD